MSTKGWVREGRTWKAPGFTQEPTHPVCAVNWEDAKAFCVWLTQKERTAGRLGADQEYRLPTDAEWSQAAGMDELKNGTPEQKMTLTTGYSWGPDWPPPPGAGNLAGYEIRGRTWPDDWATLTVGDGYAGTAPVGQYSANQFGLYDLDGNVEEWCGDLFNAADAKRVIRGSAFTTGIASTAQWANREACDPQLRATCYGFRVVLSVGESAH